MKNILIYTVTAGSGHNTVANTIKSALINKYGKNVNILIIDFLKDYKTPFRAFIYDNTYRFVVKYFRSIYNLCFKLKTKKRPVNKNSLDIKLSLIGKYKKILETIRKFKPHYILCTHFLPAIAISNLKKKNLIDIPVGSVVTDFTVCPFTEQATNINTIFLACNELVNEAKQIGFKENQIKVLGFPSKFNKNALIKNYEDENKLSIIIMSGSGSFRYLRKNIKLLIKENLDINLDLINGKDKKSFYRNQKFISKYSKGNTVINNYGYVDFINNESHKQILNNCDIMITKCGANSLLEGLNNSKVIITSKKLAQQEIENINYFKEKIPMFFIDKKTTLVDIIKDNNFNSSYFLGYREKINNLLKENIANSYADFIINNSKE